MLDLEATRDGSVTGKNIAAQAIQICSQRPLVRHRLCSYIFARSSQPLAKHIQPPLPWLNLHLRLLGVGAALMADRKRDRRLVALAGRSACPYHQVARMLDINNGEPRCRLHCTRGDIEPVPGIQNDGAPLRTDHFAPRLTCTTRAWDLPQVSDLDRLDSFGGVDTSRLHMDEHCIWLIFWL